MLRRIILGAAASALLSCSLVACGGSGTTASGGGAPAATTASGSAAPAATTASGAAPAATTASVAAPAATTASGSAAAGSADAGKPLYDGNGCAACHSVKGQGGKIGPDLTAVGTRLSQQQIIDQLKDPKQRPAPYTQVTGGAVMPKPALTDAQINDLSAYVAAQKG